MVGTACFGIVCIFPHKSITDVYPVHFSAQGNALFPFQMAEFLAEKVTEWIQRMNICICIFLKMHINILAEVPVL